LSIPHDGHNQDIIHTKVFEDYIRNNVASWFDWSQKNGLDVERMEDLILVTGCTFVTSWAAAVFLGRSGVTAAFLGRSEDAQFSICQDGDGIGFEFDNTQGNVVRHCSRFHPVRSPCYD
jgi:hypothetical protein